MVTASVLDNPPGSVTFSVTVYWPAVFNLWWK
jgi:hypothetical protein